MVALEDFSLILVHHSKHNVSALLRRERGFARSKELAVDLEHRRFASSDEKIRSPFLYNQLEQLIEFHGLGSAPDEDG